MLLISRTPTQASAVALNDAKQHLRVLADDDDLLIQRYIDAAAREIEAYCEIALTRQTISLTVLSDGSDIIPLPIGPLAPDADVTINGVPMPGTATAGRWPVLTLPDTFTGPLRISYEAGFGDDARHVPDDLQLAIMEQAAFAYDNRADPDAKPGLVPAAARIAARYKRVRL